ncbi:hypothetical protein EYC84_010801 [Monilinia fructicola]|uniref:Uncharacterized protein n=1 Tax=Monilinia fructicola TaxID=38448 RepID=A0A5M9J6B7_MONFR|nr:hypothetical protein EYC84_010801 [Monilinia fructicola]
MTCPVAERRVKFIPVRTTRVCLVPNTPSIPQNDIITTVKAKDNVDSSQLPMANGGKTLKDRNKRTWLETHFV